MWMRTRVVRVRGPTDEPDDPELLRRMRRGDEFSLERLYRRYGGLVYTLALRIVGDPELAREVLQDTFLRAWDGRETYDPARGRMAWWLMGIARNRAIDLLRSRPHQARRREQQRLPREQGEAESSDAEAFASCDARSPKRWIRSRQRSGRRSSSRTTAA